MIDSTASTSGDTGSTSTPDAGSPVSSAPSTPDTSTQAPSWDDAFAAQGLTGSPDPDSDAPSPTAPAPATVEPVAAAPEPVPAAPDAKGPIPFERHEAILANTRKRAAEEVVGQVQQHYGSAIEFQTKFRTDPTGTLTQLINEAVADPDMGPQIVAHLARTLGQRRTQTEEPQPDLQTADGDLVYSAGQLQKREQWLRRQMAEEVNQRLAPIEQERQAQAQQKQAEQQAQQTRQVVSSRLGEFSKRPGFKGNEQVIAERQQQYVDSGLDTWSALGLAYVDVYNEKELPRVQAESQNKLVQTAFAKSQASASNPGQVAPSTLPRPKSWDDAFSAVGLGGR